MISREDYLGLRATLVKGLTDDWAPHVSVIADINRAFRIEDVEIVTAETLEVMKRLIEEEIVLPGEIDLDGGRFSGYQGSKEEVWVRVEQQIPVGYRAKYDFPLWFDLGIAFAPEEEEPNPEGCVAPAPQHDPC